MTNRRFVSYIVSTFVLGAVLIGGCSAAHAAEAGWHPSATTAKGNAPSAARAQAARFNVPGGCVTTYGIDAATGNLTRHTTCEYSPALRARLASTGR